MGPFRIIVVDDHKIIRDGLASILKDEPSIDLVGSVSSGDELLELMKHQLADVILLDMNMPQKSGIEVAHEVKELFPYVKILMNTMSEAPDEIEKALAAGVDGYLLKTSGSDELIKAIHMVAVNGTYFGSAVVKTFINNLATPVPIAQRLTPTELKIVGMVYAEKNHQQIVDELGMTKGTLTAHFQNMYRKLKIETEMGLVKYALKEKLIG